MKIHREAANWAGLSVHVVVTVNCDQVAGIDDVRILTGDDGNSDGVISGGEWTPLPMAPVITPSPGHTKAVLNVVVPIGHEGYRLRISRPDDIETDEILYGKDSDLELW